MFPLQLTRVTNPCHSAPRTPARPARRSPSTPAPQGPRKTETPAPAPRRPARPVAARDEEGHGGDPGARGRARRDGELMHAYLRDLLVRWEDPAAFEACLAAAPAVPGAREQALRFLAAFEARGWRHLRRRTELPLEGAAATGGWGRADLVVWAEDRLHLLDFKHSRAFGDAELEAYRLQLQRYAEALRRREGLPVSRWLVPLRASGEESPFVPLPEEG